MLLHFFRRMSLFDTPECACVCVCVWLRGTVFSMNSGGVRQHKGGDCSCLITGCRRGCHGCCTQTGKVRGKKDRRSIMLAWSTMAHQYNKPRQSRGVFHMGETKARRRGCQDLPLSFEDISAKRSVRPQSVSVAGRRIQGLYKTMMLNSLG